MDGFYFAGVIDRFGGVGSQFFFFHSTRKGILPRDARKDTGKAIPRRSWLARPHLLRFLNARLLIVINIRYTSGPVHPATGRLSGALRYILIQWAFKKTPSWHFVRSNHLDNRINTILI